MRLLRRTVVALAIFPFLAIPEPGIADGTLDLDQAKSMIRRGEAAAAREVLDRLVAAGNAAAMTQLGLLYYAGHGVAADEARAYALFERAAQAEDRDAMFLLGRMNLLGHGPARNHADADRDAARWFFEAARRGHVDAQYHLGLLFYAGTGVQKNPEEAMKWIRRAADNGHEAARRFTPSR
jgi:TPR repeat protein